MRLASVLTSTTATDRDLGAAQAGRPESGAACFIPETLARSSFATWPPGTRPENLLADEQE